MNIYDKINDLAKALKVTPEVVDYKKARDKMEVKPENKKMVEDFRKKQFELYSMQLQGQELPKEKVEQMNSLFSIISTNPEIRDYLDAEMKFSRLWEDIMKALGEAAGIDDLGLK